MSKFLNKKKINPLGTIIIIITLLTGVIFVWQYWGVLKEETTSLEVEIAKNRFMEEKEETPGEKLEEVILTERPEGESKIGNIKIEKIKIDLNSGMPEGIKIGPLDESRVSSGYCILKEKDKTVLASSYTGKYSGYATFNYRENKYILVTTLNTGTAGPIEIHFLFIIYEDSKVLTPIGDVKWGLFTSRDSSFSIIGYGEYLYFESHTRGHLSAGTYFEDVELLVIEKDTLRDEKSFHASNISWGYSFPIPTNLSTSLIKKDGKLYAKVKSGYCYYIEKSPEIILVHWGIADEYYLLNEDGKLIESSFEFKNEYLKAATEYNEMLEKYDKPLVKYDEEYFEIWEKLSEETKSVIEFYYGNWFNPLLCRTLNYVLAGEEKKAWSTFEEDFDKFSEEYPLEYPVRYIIKYPMRRIEKVEITSPQELKQKIQNFFSKF